MSPKTRRVSLLIIRIVLGLLFVVSAIGKLIDGSDARYLVELMATEFYWLIEYTFPIVITLSIIELLLGLLLLWSKRLGWIFTASLLMILTFSGILGYFYLQGMNVASCGCFGAFGFASGIEFTLIRNAILAVLIVSGLILNQGKS